MAAQTDISLKGPFIILYRGGPIPIPFYFPLNPQHFEVRLPARGQIHQTVENNYLDDFSGPRAVLAHVTLRGTFSYDFGLVPGSMVLKGLEVLHETFNGLSRQLKAQVGAATDFIALSRLYYWRVWIKDLAYRIHSREPLLYYYELQLVRLEDYLSPAAAVEYVVNSPVGAAIGTASSAVRGAIGSVVDKLPVIGAAA